MLFTLLVATILLQAPPRPVAPDHITVPLHVEGNRPYIDLTFRRADGSTRTAIFLVDSAGGGFSLGEKLARDIDVTWGRRIRADEDTEVAIVMTLSHR